MKHEFETGRLRTWLAAAAALALAAGASAAPLRFNRIYSSHMVLQRGEPVRFCGFGEAGSRVRIEFAGDRREAVADATGRWKAEFPARGDGGPYTVKATDGATTVTLEDVLMGEVWFCTGQSNMWWPLSWAGDPEKEVAAADEPRIRLLDVALVAAEEETDEPYHVRGWRPCTPLSARDFSACAYHFARALREKLGDVPVGLIGAGWGGPPICHFLPSPPRDDGYLARARGLSEAAGRAWAEIDARRAEGRALFTDGTRLAALARADGDPARTEPARFPQALEHETLDQFAGVAVFRRDVEIPAEWEGREIEFDLGRSALAGVAYLDGARIGSAKDWDAPSPGSDWQVPWVFPAGRAKPGRHRLAVFVGCPDRLSWWGAFSADMSVRLRDDRAKRVPLADGRWTCEKAVSIPKDPDSYGGSWGARIFPFFQMPVKGVIFYQGEADCRRMAADYLADQKRLVNLMRKGWGREDLTYICMQLANLDRPNDDDNGYCEVREAQRLTAEEMENVGCACSMDIGDPHNIHPPNKREQGRRMALQALEKAYRVPGVTADGPRFASLEANGREATVRFRPSPAGIVQRTEGRLRGFETYGPDGEWHFCEAKLEGGMVKIASHVEIRGVRYLWRDNPSYPIPLFGENGLPALPFRCKLP